MEQNHKENRILHFVIVNVSVQLNVLKNFKLCNSIKQLYKQNIQHMSDYHDNLNYSHVLLLLKLQVVFQYFGFLSCILIAVQKSHSAL